MDPKPRRSLTGLVARGTVINASATLVAGVMFAVRNLIAAAFMGPEVLAVWTVASLVFLTAIALRGAGVVERFVADREQPARGAFNDAFSVGLVFSLLIGTVVAALSPAFALAYDDPRMLLPILAMAGLVITDGLKFPMWWHYRELHFGRLRTLMLVDAVGSVVFAIPLLILGWEYWALIAGAALASVATILLAWGLGPRPRFHLPNRATVRRYVSFGGPVLLLATVGILLGQVGNISLRYVGGLEVLGWLAIAAIPFFAFERLIAVLNQSVYPALVRRGEASRERAVEVMQRLVWAGPVPVALAIGAAAPFLVPVALGEVWRPAGYLVAVVVLAAVVRSIAYPFAVVVLSSGHTSYLSRFAGIFAGSFTLIALPAMFLFGVPGYAVGMVLVEVILAIERWRVVRRELPGVRLATGMFDDITVAALPGLAVGACLLATPEWSWSQRVAFATVAGGLGLLAVAIRHHELGRTLLAMLRSREPVAESPDPVPAEGLAVTASRA